MARIIVGDYESEFDPAGEELSQVTDKQKARWLKSIWSGCFPSEESLKVLCRSKLIKRKDKAKRSVTITEVGVMLLNQYEEEFDADRCRLERELEEAESLEVAAKTEGRA